MNATTTQTTTPSAVAEPAAIERQQPATIMALAATAGLIALVGLVLAVLD